LSVPLGAKYITATQDTSPKLCSERRDKYLFGRAKTGGLGQVTTKKMENNEKQEKPQGALTPPLFSLPLGSKIYYGQVKVGDLS